MRHRPSRPVRSLSTLGACAITAGLLLPPASQATKPQLDQQWQGPVAATICTYSQWLAAQSPTSNTATAVDIAFVPTFSGRLSSVRVVIDATRNSMGQPSTEGALGVELSSDPPESAVTTLATGSVSVGAINTMPSAPGGLGNVVDVRFSPRPRVTAGEKYWITLTSLGESSTCIGVATARMAGNPPQEAFGESFGYDGPRSDPAAVNGMVWLFAVFIKPG